ncbi:MAG: beta-lactamase regulator AmpE, partial [Colwellia sp.]
MSLISLLIALFADKHLAGNAWQFESYFQRYIALFKKNKTLTSFHKSTATYAIFLLLPPVALFALLAFVGNGVLNLAISTLVLMVTIGCKPTRDRYRAYLDSAYRGDTTTSEMNHLQLLEDKNLPPLGFGQALVWLNYRYYIAIMIFFIFFGAAGALFYRLLTSVTEYNEDCLVDTNCDKETVEQSQQTFDEKHNEAFTAPNVSTGCTSFQDILFYVDWLPVRISALGYMFVGHFSRALPTWLEAVFSNDKPNHEVLIDVAQQSEDITVDNEDCSAEPTLLVRLAKRNVLLILSVLSVL